MTYTPFVTTGNYSDLSGTPIPTNNNQLTNGAGYITGYTVTSGDVTAHEGDITITESQISDLGTYATTASLATVATTGSYNDLSNTPTIPTNNNQLTNGVGYITGYTVTSGDVTAHQGSITITESQISDLGNYVVSGEVNPVLFSNQAAFPFCLNLPRWYRPQSLRRWRCTLPTVVPGTSWQTIVTSQPTTTN